MIWHYITLHYLPYSTCQEDHTAVSRSVTRCADRGSWRSRTWVCRTRYTRSTTGWCWWHSLVCCWLQRPRPQSHVFNHTHPSYITKKHTSYDTDCLFTFKHLLFSPPFMEQISSNHAISILWTFLFEYKQRRKSVMYSRQHKLGIYSSNEGGTFSLCTAMFQLWAECPPFCRRAMYRCVQQ